MAAPMARQRSMPTAERTALRPIRARGSLLPLVAAGAAVTAGLRGLGFVASPSVGISNPCTPASQRLRSTHIVSARGGAEDYEFRAAEVFGAPKVGDKFSGVVTRVLDFGCFVDFGGKKEGLVPRSKLTEKYVENLKVQDVVQEGQGVTVWISEVNGEKVTLSMAQNKVGPRPAARGPPDVSGFEGVSDQEWLAGKVVSVMTYGAFVEVTPPAGNPAQGLVHVTQIKDGFVEDVSDEVTIGQDVKVRVLEVDTEAKKLKLTMKSAAPGGKGVKDVSAFVDVPDTEWLPGVVKELVNFGAFVSVTPPNGGAAVDGLLHISQIKEGFIEDPGEELEFDQEIKVRILEVNQEAGNLALTMRPKAPVEPAA